MLEQKVINDILQEMDKATKEKLLYEQFGSCRRICEEGNNKTVLARYLCSNEKKEQIVEVFGFNCDADAKLIMLLWNNAFEMICEIERLRYENSFLKEKLEKREI